NSRRLHLVEVLEDPAASSNGRRLAFRKGDFVHHVLEPFENSESRSSASQSTLKTNPSSGAHEWRRCLFLRICVPAYAYSLTAVERGLPWSLLPCFRSRHPGSETAPAPRSSRRSQSSRSRRDAQRRRSLQR